MRASLLCLLVLASCQVGDDMARPGTWRASGANDVNLRAMLDDPRDAASGRAALTARGQAGAVAVQRLEAGQRFPLPVSNLSKVAPTGAEPVAASSNAR